MNPRNLARTGWFCILMLLAHYVTAQRKDVASPRLLLPVKQGLKWGYADTSRHIIIPAQFDAANPFAGRIAVIEKGRKAFAIDATGKILTPGFDQLFLLDDSLLSIYLNEISDTLGGWGISSISGNLILPPLYDEIVKINANLFSFRKDSLWGVVNREGVVIVPLAYDTISLVYNNYLLLTKGKNCGLVGVDGKRYLEDEFSGVYIPNKWVIAAYRNKTKGPRKKNWGAYDHTPEIFIPFGADSIFRVNAYFTGVEKNDSLACYFSVAAKNYTSCSYKELLPVDLYWVKLFDFKGRCGLADTNGKIIVPVQYADVTIGGRGTWLVADEKKKWGVYSGNGNLLISPAYTQIQPFRANVAVIYDGSKQGLINSKGELLITPGNQQIIIRGNTVKILRPDNSATFVQVDAEGRILSQSDYDEFRVIKIKGAEASANIGEDIIRLTRPRTGTTYTPLNDSLEWFLDGKKFLWGLRNSFSGDTLIPAQFDDVIQDPGNFTLVSIHKPTTGVSIDGQTSIVTDRYGLVNDTTGKLVLHPVYATIRVEDTSPGGFVGYVRATLSNGTMALVTTDGTERTMSYMYIDNVQNGYARMCLAGKWTISEPGEVITNIFHFTTEQSINMGKTFGVVSTYPNFFQKNICIAGGKWGYLDSTGHIAIAATYDAAKPAFAKTGIVKQEKKWGMIDMKAATRIPFAYDALYYMRTDSSSFVIAQMNGMRYGYLDRDGNIRIPADLKQSKSLGKGFIGFSRTGKWGVMTADGKPVCDEQYVEILPFSEGIAAVRTGIRWGYMDTSGVEIIAPTYEKAGPFKSGAARIVSNHRWGYIDKTGMVIVEPKFLQAADFSGEAAPVKTREGFGLINKEGKWMQKPTWRSITALDSTLPGFFILRSDYASGICRADGKIIVPLKYDSYKYLGEGRIAYRTGMTSGLLDTTGKIITPPVFDQFKPYSEHFAAASQNSKWGFVNTNGKFVIQPQYTVVGNFTEHRAYTFENEISTFIDTTGKMVLRLKKGKNTFLGYSEGKYVISQLNLRKEVDHMFYMTRHGVRVNKMEYKEALPFQDGAARVRVNSPKWGLISYTGYFIVKPRYFVLSPFDNGLARFQMRFTLGTFSLDGKPVLPLQYDAIYFDTDLNVIRFEKGNALGYLFQDGRMCWPETE